MTQTESEKGNTFDVQTVLQILPHRYPFLLVDKIIDYDLEKKFIVGQKNVTINDQFFCGHFPGFPLMPGVLLLEAIAQAGSVLVHLLDPSVQLAALMSIREAKFRRQVVPGDILHLHAWEPRLSRKGGRIKGKAMVGDQVAVEADFSVVFLDRSED